MAALVMGASGANAAIFAESSLQRLWEQSRLDELAREVAGKPGAEPLAAQALLAIDTQDPPAMARARTLADQCVQQHPASATCHYALGAVLGAQALSGGMLQGVRLVGPIQAAFGRAAELRPEMFEALLALQQTYLLTPGFAGGSVDKARALEQQVPASQPEVRQLLRVQVAARQERWDDVERELMAIAPGTVPSFHQQLVAGWSLWLRHVSKERQFDRARERFTALAAALPHLAAPVYWLGRVAADAGQTEEALRLYDRARGLTGALALPLDYRAGIAHEALGQKEQALAAYQRYIRQPRANARNVEDARKRVKALG